MKIVINRCYGGFGISEVAQEMLGVDTPFPDIARNDPELIRVVETLGDAANGEFAELVIVDIPDNVEWYISDYDGLERVEEAHRSWP